MESLFSVRLVVMVRVRHQATLLIFSLVLAHLVFGQASSGPAAQAPLHNSTNGTIVLGGGYLDEEGISALLRRVVGLAGGARTSLVIIPTADPRLEPAVSRGSHRLLVDYEREARVRFATLGVNQVSVLHTRDRAVANSNKFAVPLRSANCVWIPGGDPELLFKVYPNTTVQRELQRILGQGGVIVGDSAGAEIIGQGLLVVHLENPTEMPTVQEGGLRLLKNTFVLTHVNRYKAGIVEQGSNTFVYAHRDMLTLLIEENTAVMIQHDQIARLLGSGRAGIVDGGNHASNSPMWLSGSARYDLRRRILVQ